jgi:ketol-acid reductoisomerase
MTDRPRAQIRYEKDADISLIRARKVAILGYGSQGHAHALNLHESGVSVIVGLPEGSKSRAKVEKDGLRVLTPSAAAAEADLIAILAPDTAQAALYERDVAPHLTAGKVLLFAHGFNIRYGTIVPPAGVDVVLIAPKSPGHRLRETYREGGGVPSLLAVHQDASGRADAIALSYAAGIGSCRVGVITTTFTEETETDLFGEQTVLCGGVSSLVKMGFETLVEAGYQPEIAYFECLHELKLIVDLMYRGGLNYMRYSVSDTAEYGDYVSGDQVVGPESRVAMKAILGRIQDGTFAKAWIDEMKAGGPNFRARRAAETTHELEQVGAQLRSMMPFVSPVTIRPGE